MVRSPTWFVSVVSEAMLISELRQGRMEGEDKRGGEAFERSLNTIDPAI
jgi:hypothetical protein